MRQKSAQITAFMIIGLLVLFVVGIVLYTRFQLQERPEFVPEHLEPLQEFVHQCIYQQAADAAIRLGRTGGYLQYPLEIRADPTAYLNTTVMMPYWYGGREYITKNDLASQIEHYVDDNVGGCLDNLSTFREEFDITILEEFESDVEIYPDSFTVTADFPLLIKTRRELEENRISTFSTDVQLPVGRAFKTAQKVITLENRLQFLENNTLDMIASSTLPFIGGDLDCKPKLWDIETDIKPHLKSMIIANNKFYTFEDTKKDKSWGPYPDYYESFYHFDLDLRKDTGAAVDIMYDPTWNTLGMDAFDLSVEPNRAGIVEPAHNNLPLSTCINLYNHRYSLEYPVTVRIVEPARKFAQGDSYVFSFATKVVIDENKPARHIRRSDRTDLDTYTVQEICNTTEKSVRIHTYDYVTGNSLNNVSVDYQCARLKCDAGTTHLPREGNLILGYNAYVEADLPKCLGGTLIAEKDGYLRSVQPDVSVGEFTVDGEKQDFPGDSIDLYLTPLQELDINVTVREFGASQLGELLEEGKASTRSLKETEMALFSFSNAELDYEATLYIIPGEEPHFINGDRYSNQFLLPARDATYTIDFKLLDENEMVGGLIGNFTVSSEKIIESDEIELSVIRKYDYPFDRTEAIRELMELLEENSETYRPRFIRD